ncbi:MAG TPA: hypothetical protein VEN78_15055 [Bradyrhizobium sp.]|nr:hypothetical protein [Bradyrhizobium sp.]
MGSSPTARTNGRSKTGRVSEIISKPHPEQITIAPGLTFDALAAGKPGAPPVLLLHDAAAAVGAGGRGDRRFHLVGRLGRRHWLGACHAVAIAWSVDQFLDIVSLLRRIGAN